MNSTPHPRPGNADIPIGGFSLFANITSPFARSPPKLPRSQIPTLSERRVRLSFLVSAFSVSPLSSFCFLASPFSIPQPFCFNTLADSPTQRQPLNPFLINHFRTLFIATGGVPPNSQKGTRLKPDPRRPSPCD